MLKEISFWCGVTILLAAAFLVVFLCGTCVGVVVGTRWKLVADSKPEETGDIVYVCSSKPSCYHMVAVCGGVTMKPLKQCDHCSKIKKKSR